MGIKMECDKCGEKQERFKFLKKVKDKRYCQNCYSENRKNRREKTIKDSGIKDDLKELNQKYKRDYMRKYQRKRYVKKPKIILKEHPIIKNSKKVKDNSNKSYSWLRKSEEAIIIKKVVKEKAVSYDEAREVIDNLKERLKETREKMKSKGKSEEKIKQKEMQLLEELWQF